MYLLLGRNFSIPVAGRLRLALRCGGRSVGLVGRLGGLAPAAAVALGGAAALLPLRLLNVVLVHGAIHKSQVLDNLPNLQ